MIINVAPKVALVDEIITICVHDLMPKEKVRITACMDLPWVKSEKYESFGIFIADENGCVDLSKQKPESGTYDWVDSMGLIASLQKVSSKNINIGLNLDIENSMFLNLTFESSHSREAITIERMFKSPSVKRQIIEEGFIGELFYSEQSNKKTIILFGGSDGNITALSLMAGPLASRGFNVLSVGYFGEKGLPQNLQEIPLEYFENVFLWINKNSIIKTSQLYLHGTSKGGELALLIASKYNCFSKVVACQPHSYCFEGLDGMLAADNVSSWTFDGKPLPFIKLDNNIFLEEQKSCIKENKPFGIACCYIKGLERADRKEEARIKIENAHVDLLLIAGKKDSIWNSYDGCNEIIDTLRKCDYAHKYEFLGFEEMGHVLPIPYILPLSEVLSIKFGDGIFTCGGTIKGNSQGQSDSWFKTIKFFESN